MTGYSAELLSVFSSPGTGSTSIRMIRRSPKSTDGKSRNTTVFVSSGLMMSIVCFFTIGVGLCWIVSVTSIFTSWLSPPLATATANARSVEASTVFSADSERTCPPGTTVTCSMFVPCRPLGVPPVEPEAAEPLIRSQIGTIERVLARSGVWTKLESGTSTPLISSSCSVATDGSLKRSSQTTSLATSRSA